MDGVLEEYAGRPVEFAAEVLRGSPWRAQGEILQALAEHPRVTVRSGHGVGKTWVAAAAALWFLYTRAPVTVLTTAPTHRQVREVLWREIRRLHRRMFAATPPPRAPRGEVRETALRLSEDRFALGLTTDEPDRFQGFHCPHLLVLVDEASGVEEEIYQAIQGVLTGAEARLLLIGNPLHARGSFYESHRSAGWRRFAISAFDSPNLAGRSLAEALERPAAAPALVTAGWIEERLREWGEDSPLYQSRVLGEFPDQATDALLRLSWIEEAVARGRAPLRPEGPVEVGVDVARFGDCETVAVVRRGPAVLALEAWRGLDLMASAERVRRIAEEHRPEVIRVDSVGMGGGVLDRLREEGVPGVVGVNAGRAAGNTERFLLLRDEIFFGLRDRFRAGEIAIPEDPKLISQLQALTYDLTPRGQQRVASKDEMARLGHASPDRADALALAFAPVEAARRPVVLLGRGR